MKHLNFTFCLLALAGIVTFSSCSDDEAPPIENEEEVIDKVVLTFTPNEGSILTFEAHDADGVGPADFEIDDIVLNANTSYTLEISFFNEANSENISNEVLEEGEEHMIFFSWTDGLFTDPTGDGNVGEENRNDPINYADKDINGEPIGLTTNWDTGIAATGEFRFVLKHQPGEKTSTSSSRDGETDIDLTWGITIQ